MAYDQLKAIDTSWLPIRDRKARLKVSPSPQRSHTALGQDRTCNYNQQSSRIVTNHTRNFHGHLGPKGRDENVRRHQPIQLKKTIFFFIGVVSDTWSLNVPRFLTTNQSFMNDPRHFLDDVGERTTRPNNGNFTLKRYPWRNNDSNDFQLQKLLCASKPFQAICEIRAFLIITR